jgi:hypothetical protein
MRGIVYDLISVPIKFCIIIVGVRIEKQSIFL